MVIFNRVDDGWSAGLGSVAEGLGLLVTFLGAACLMVAGVVAGVVWKLPEPATSTASRPSTGPSRSIAFAPELDTGPVLVNSRIHRCAGT